MGRIIRLHAYTPRPRSPVFLCVVGRAYWQERGEGGGRGGAESYDSKKAWSSINHSVLTVHIYIVYSSLARAAFWSLSQTTAAYLAVSGLCPLSVFFVISRIIQRTLCALSPKGNFKKGNFSLSICRINAYVCVCNVECIQFYIVFYYVKQKLLKSCWSYESYQACHRNVCRSVEILIKYQRWRGGKYWVYMEGQDT